MAKISGRYASEQDIRRKLVAFVDQGAPIEFAVPFGGYKGPRAESCPHLNWAEVFWLSYLRRNGARIAGAYAPGVAFKFSYASGVMDLVSNYPLTWQDQYLQEFGKLAAYFSDARVKMDLVDIASFFPSLSDLRQAVQDNFHAQEDVWFRSAERERKIRSAERNLVRNGVVDLKGLDPVQWAERVENSARLCHALDSLDVRRRYNKFSSRIQLVFVRGPGPSLHVASCRSSSLHPGVANGFVDARKVSHPVERIAVRAGPPDAELRESDKRAHPRRR
jgi:hypothetical protein